MLSGTSLWILRSFQYSPGTLALRDEAHVRFGEHIWFRMKISDGRFRKRDFDQHISALKGTHLIGNTRFIYIISKCSRESTLLENVRYHDFQMAQLIAFWNWKYLITIACTQLDESENLREHPDIGDYMHTRMQVHSPNYTSTEEHYMTWNSNLN